MNFHQDAHPLAENTPGIVCGQVSRTHRSCNCNCTNIDTKTTSCGFWGFKPTERESRGMVKATCGSFFGVMFGKRYQSPSSYPHFLRSRPQTLNAQAPTRAAAQIKFDNKDMVHCRKKPSEGTNSWCWLISATIAVRTFCCLVGSMCDGR